MADEIVQQLGFDASAGLEALAKMDQALSGFDAQLSRVAESMSVWNEHGRETVQVLKDIASGAASAAAAMSKLQAAFSAQQQQQASGAAGQVAAGPGAGEQTPGGAAKGKKIKPEVDASSIEEADRAAAKFVVSWETLSRVVMTQAIVRAMSALRDMMHEAFDSNLQFMTRIAEIQSISPGVSNSLDMISHSVANLSREFNIPLAQVAEAQYQAISNQFASAAQQTDVLTAAFKLSKVAVMDAGQAVNLIAGTLNAYHMQSSQAEQVAAKFFATIQIGRVRGEELASVLGRVTAVSSELGVSLDELNAMMVTLTVSGVKPAEAATALRSAMMALIKPSQDLKKELHDLGYESGPQMIAALGLEGALVKLRQSTDENMAAFARLIPNVRAISGALRETDDSGKRTADAVQHLREMSVATFNEKYKLFIESDAQKTLAELNKFKTFLTTDLGAAIVEATDKFLGVVGGADAVGAAVKALIPVLGLGVTAFGGFAVALGSMAMSARLATLGLGPLGLAINGLMVAMLAYGAFDFANTRIIQGIRQAEEEFRKAESDRLSAIQQVNQRRIEEEDRANQAVVQRAEQALTERRRDYFKMVDETQVDNKRLTDDSHATMLKIVDEAEKEVHVLRNLANEADRAISDSMKRGTEIAGTLADTRFRWYESQWKSTWEQQKDFAGQAFTLASQAEEMMSKAKTPQDIDVAQSIYKRAQAYAQESMQIAQRRHDTLGQQDAEAAIERVLESELAANEGLRASKQKQAKAAADAAADEERTVTRMRELAKEISKDMDLFDKKNQPLAGPDREQAIAKTKAAIQEFQGLMFASKKWEMSDWLNFDAMKRKMRETMEGAVTKAEVRDLLVAPESLAKLNERITTGLGRINLDVFVGGDHAKLIGKTIEEQFKAAENYPRQQAQAARAVQEAYDQQRDALAQIESRQRQITANMAVQQEGSVGAWQATKVGLNMLTGVFGTTGRADLQAAVTSFREINEAILEMQKHPLKIEPKALDDLVAKTQELKKNLPWSLDLNFDRTEANLKTLKEMFDYAERIRGVQSKYPNLDQQMKGATEGIDRLKQAFPDSGKQVQDITNQFSETTGAINQANSAMATFQSAIESAADAMSELAAAAATVQPPQAEEGPMTAAHGGMAFLAGGGRPRGTDVIPAMLSPGEMVMSAATTRRFASQLTAMNAGVKPSYHSQGGHTTNIGDINVTVQGGGTGRQTARSIATELRRELRRGTSVL
jgi:TP901 family phage tail tape measure protein